MVQERQNSRYQNVDFTCRISCFVVVVVVFVVVVDVVVVIDHSKTLPRK